MAGAGRKLCPLKFLQANKTNQSPSSFSLLQIWKGEAGEGVSYTTPQLSMEIQMAESVYKVIELVGTSTDSWEKAAKAAVDRAAKTLRDLRVAEVTSQDLVITDGKVEAYRVKVKVSFKFEGAS